MKPSIKIILLMFFSGVILAVYGLLPEKPLLFGDWGFRQIPLYKLLTEGTSAVIDDTTAYEEEEADTAQAEPTDTTKQTILLCGDSMVGQICYRMSQYAYENGHELICVSWVSSSSRTWAKCDTLEHYVNKYHPTHIFISLGSNEMYSRDMDAMESKVRAVLSKVDKSIPVIWIGPPNWCQDGGINKVLRKVLGKRAFFPSFELKYTYTADGHHPDNESSRRWVDAIAKWMNEGHSIHPFLMRTPKTKKGAMKLFVIGPKNGGKGTVKDSEEIINPEDEMPENEAAGSDPSEQVPDPASAPAKVTEPVKTSPSRKDSIK